MPAMICMIAANKVKPTAQPMVVWSGRPANDTATAAAQSSAAPSSNALPAEATIR
jgi:hypothetical protein